MEYACIYNPSLGDENNIEEQIVYSFHEKDEQSAKMHIGVAQGLAELANTFDGHPVSWVKTGTRVILVQRLESEPDDSWRSGFWIVCGVNVGPQSPKTGPQDLRNIIRDYYQQWALHQGSIASHIQISEKKDKLKRWWDAVFLNWTGVYELGAAGVLPYLRVAPGTLSPQIPTIIDDICREHQIYDLLVTQTHDSAYVWSGRQLEQDSRLSIQSWLGECGLCEDDAYAEKSGFVFHLRLPQYAKPRDDLSVETQGLTPSPPNDTEAKQDHAETKTAPEPSEAQLQEEVNQLESMADLQLNSEPMKSIARATSEVSASPEPLPEQGPLPGGKPRGISPTAESTDDALIQSPAPSEVASNYRSLSGLSSYIPRLNLPASLSSPAIPQVPMPSMPTMPSFSVPSMFSTPQMPDFSSWSLPSLGVPSLSFMSKKDDNSAQPDEDTPPPNKFLGFGKTIKLPQGEFWVLSYRRGPFIYSALHRVDQFPVAVSPSPELQDSLDALGMQIEGFSFAFFSPAPFAYLVLDHDRATICSTFPRVNLSAPPDYAQAHQAMSDSIRETPSAPDKNVALTRGNWWLYRTPIVGATEVTFAARWLRKDAGSLLGALHRDTREWLDNYKKLAT